MKRLIVVALLAACGGHDHAAPSRAASQASPSDAGAAPVADDDRPARCGHFADDVARCERVPDPLTPDEQKSVRAAAYAVCTGTSHDADAIDYWGDVDRRMACMAGKRDCHAIADCLDPDKFTTRTPPAP